MLTYLKYIDRNHGSVLNINKKYKIFFHNLMNKSKKKKRNWEEFLNRYQISANYKFKRKDEKKKKNQESHDISKLNPTNPPI